MAGFYYFVAGFSLFLDGFWPFVVGFLVVCGSFLAVVTLGTDLGALCVFFSDFWTDFRGLWLFLAPCDFALWQILVFYERSLVLCGQILVLYEGFWCLVDKF